MFRVLVFTHPSAPRGMYYSVYRGRKLAMPVRYEFESDAIKNCVQLCCMEQSELKKGSEL